MIDLLYAGWKAAQLWARWREKPPEMVEGSIEDVRELRQLAEALYDDNQRLIGIAQEQEKKIASLKSGMIALVFFSIILNAVIAWGICAYLQH